MHLIGLVLTECRVLVLTMNGILDMCGNGMLDLTENGFQFDLEWDPGLLCAHTVKLSKGSVLLCLGMETKLK